MEATKSHVQARKHKCDDQLIIKCWFHKFRIEGSWNLSNYEFEMLVWRCTNLPTAVAKPEYVNAKAVQATGFKGMPKVLSSTKPNPKSSLANTFIACQYSLADCRGQGHITATGLAADGMQIQMIKQQITRQVPPKRRAGWGNPLTGKGMSAARTQFSISSTSWEFHVIIAYIYAIMEKHWRCC